MSSTLKIFEKGLVNIIHNMAKIEIGKFLKKSKGYYFDIGCFHPIRYSNTLFIQKRLARHEYRR